MATPFWKRFSSLCDAKNITPNRVMLDTGLNNGNPSFWKNGRIPSMKILTTLAEYFGVTVDYLLGGGGEEKAAPAGAEEEKPRNETAQGTNKEDGLLNFALFGAFEPTLSKEKLDEIRRYAEYVKNR